MNQTTLFEIPEGVTTQSTPEVVREKIGFDLLIQKQPRVVRILKNSIKKKRIAHAYLFKGGAGVGKKEVAIEFIKRFFCKSPNGVNACGKCSQCNRIMTSNHPDVHIVAPDGASIKIEQIRQLQKEFAWKGVEGEKKAYLIIDAEKMTHQSSNSLLKFLEEPSQKTLAILTTTQPHQILNTIKSRCQEISFRPLSKVQLVNGLLENNIPEESALIISQLTNDLNDAKNIYENVWFADSLSIIKNLSNKIHHKPSDAILYIQKISKQIQEKEEQQLLLDLLLLWYRDQLMHLLGREIIFKNQKLQFEMMKYSIQCLENIISKIIKAKNQLQKNLNFQLVMEQLVFFILSVSNE